MSKQNKTKKRSSGAGKGSKEHGDKKGSAATTSADKKGPDTTEKKTTGPTSPKSPASPGTSQPPAAQASAKVPTGKKQPEAAAAATIASTMKPADSKKEPAAATKESAEKPVDAKKEPAAATKECAAKPADAKKEPAAATKEYAAKPADAKGALFSKTEPAKAVQTSKPADSHTKEKKDHTGPKSPTKASRTTAPVKQPSAGKAASSQDAKSNQTKEKEEPKTKGEKESVAGGLLEAAAEVTNEKKPVVSGAAVAAAGAAGAVGAAVAAVVPSKPSVETKDKPVDAAAASQTKGEKASVAAASSKPAAEVKNEKKQVVSGAAVAAAGAAGAVGAAAAAVVSSKPSVETKDKPADAAAASQTKDKPADAAAASQAGLDALDELIDMLGGPEDAPETPKFTGPEVLDTVSSTHLDKLGERDSTIPPEYRHLLDSKPGSGIPPKVEEPPMQPMGEDDLVAALSSDFTCSTSPDKKKPKLEEGGMNDALDELMGTLEGPGENVPETPTYTGPEVTETTTATHLEELGIRDSTIPPEYRKLLDGKQDGKAVPPPEPEVPLSDAELADQLDFCCTPSPAVQPAPPGKPKMSIGEDDLVHALSSDGTCSAPPDEKKQKLEGGVMDDALDELMGTLEGPGENVPKSPVYTGPEITETATATHIEELGKRDSTIPPEYRHLLDGKEDGKVVPPHKAEPLKPLSDTELADELSKDFTCSSSPTVQPTALTKPKDLVDQKTPKAAPAEEITTCATASAVQSAAAPAKIPPAKTPAPYDPLDALAGTLGKSEPKPADTKPAVDKVKEKTGKEKVEKLGEREDTIPPDYRLQELKDKDGKPILPKPEAKPKPLSETEVVDALSEGFVTSTTKQCATLPAAKDTVKSKPVPSKEVASSSAASTVQSAASPAPASKGPVSADPVDALAGTLGKVEPAPKDSKPAVDKVKEKAKQEKGEKLGEREDTIPPEYRLTEVKDKDGKPMLPKPEEKPKPMSDTELLDALTEGFVTSPSTVHPAPLQSKKKNDKQSTGADEVITCSSASAVQAGAPLPSDSDVKIPDDAFDLLSDTLGTREPDPEENKPMVDRVKEKATSEHIDKLGERDDTIPPEYRHLLDGDEKGKPIKPVIPEKPKKPQDDTPAIDALSKGFCAAPPAVPSNQSAKDKSDKESAPSKPASKDDGKVKDPPKDKSGTVTTTKPATKDEGKAKDPVKTNEQSSSVKSDARKTSKS